jgi:hypothetical protein
MNNKERWETFLANATAAEVFSKIAKRQLMTEQIWNRWKYVQNNKQTKIGESGLDPKYYTAEWWGTPD